MSKPYPLKALSGHGCLCSSRVVISREECGCWEGTCPKTNEMNLSAYSSPRLLQGERERERESMKEKVTANVNWAPQIPYNFSVITFLLYQSNVCTSRVHLHLKLKMQKLMSESYAHKACVLQTKCHGHATSIRRYVEEGWLRWLKTLFFCLL